MTIKDFEKVPRAPWSLEIECDSLIILPGSEKDIHDSGYRCMSFIVVKDNKAIYQIGGGSDVLHIEGIGGYGYDWLTENKHAPVKVKPKSWSIDCLPKSGLLRLFNNKKMICGNSLSSMEIFTAIIKVPSHIPEKQKERYRELKEKKGEY